MAKVSGCFCWPKMPQSRRKDPKESLQLSAQNSTFDTTVGDRGSPSIPKEHDAFIEMLFRPGRHRSRTLTTSLFAPPKRRSDAAGSGGGGGGGGGGGWRRRRTNSLLSAKRYSTEEDLHLFETVPATPGAAFQREFSLTLPLRWSNGESVADADAGEERGRGRGTTARRSDVWPEYIWRLNQKRQQRCPCAGCENTTPATACARAYRHPVRHTDVVRGAYFDDDDDDDDGSPHGRGIEESGLDRRGTRGYDRPKSKGSGVGAEAEPYDVPASAGSGDGWLFCGRRSLRDRTGDRKSNSAVFQARPRSASLEQRAFRPAAAARGRAAVGVGEGEGGSGGEGGSDFPVCSWRWCGHQPQQQQHYDRPNGLYPLRPSHPPPPPHPLGHRRGCQGMMRRKSSFGLRCFACELKLETMSEEWNRVDGYYLPGRAGHRSHRAYDGEDSGYIQSDQEIEAQSGGTGRGTTQSLCPELNYVIPSGMFAVRKRPVCCHDDGGGGYDAECDDYLAPLSANFKRFQIERDQSQRYLAMNSGGAAMRDRNDTSASEDTDRQKQQMIKVPQSDDDDDDDDDDIERRQREKETRDEITSAGKFLVSADKGESEPEKLEESSSTSSKSVRDPGEGESEGKEMVGGDSVGKVSMLVEQDEEEEEEEESESKSTTMIEVTETPVDANGLPASGDIKELTVVPVRLKEIAAAAAAAAAATPPALATRARSLHLDLLHMSPPPQCSFMVDHSYANVEDFVGITTTTGSEKNPAPFKNHDMEEMRNKERNAPKQVDSIEEAAEEIYFASKPKPGNEYLARWEDMARLGKQPGSQYVVLHRKASSGNNYCHTYLPTLRENLKNSCKTK